MSKIDRFFKAILQVDKQWNESRCRICGWPLKESIDEGRTIDNCSMRPVPAKRADELRNWQPSINGEISQEVRKWFQEHEPEVWNNYLCHEHSFLFPQDDSEWYDILGAQPSIQNFYDYLVARWQEWGYKECLYRCDVCGKKDCKYYGVGKACKYPAVKEIMEGEKWTIEQEKYMNFHPKM